jgi:hypothetical protein
LEKEDLTTYLTRFSQAFQQENISITLDGQKQLAFTVWGSFNDKQISYSYKLFYFTGEEFLDKLSRFVFEMVLILKNSSTGILAKIMLTHRIDRQNKTQRKA